MRVLVIRFHVARLCLDSPFGVLIAVKALFLSLKTD
jgi:hypothetical protein